MPLLHACPQKNRRTRRFCIIACASALLFKVGPFVVGDLTFEFVGYVIDRTMP